MKLGLARVARGTIALPRERADFGESGRGARFAESPAMKLSLRVSVLLAGVVLSASASVRADDAAVVPLSTPSPALVPAPSPRPLPPQPETRVWYGWQTLTVEGASFLAMALGGEKVGGVAPLRVAGIAGMAFGPGIVHAAHGRSKAAKADLGIAVGALFVCGISGALLGEKGVFDGLGDGALIGVMTGAETTALIDAVFFAHETIRPREAPAAAWSPVVSMAKGGATAGLGGTF
jgi:hypothetical protein